MKKRTLLGIAILILIIVAVLRNYQEIFRSITPPDPVIVSSYADGSSSSLFNYSLVVKCEVLNKGGDGTVVVEATVYQGSKDWSKRKTLYLPSNNTDKVEIVFDEVKLFAKAPQYQVNVFPLGLE